MLAELLSKTVKTILGDTSEAPIQKICFGGNTTVPPFFELDEKLMRSKRSVTNVGISVKMGDITDINQEPAGPGANFEVAIVFRDPT